MRQLDEHIWETRGPLRRAGIDLGHRMTVVRMTDGRLLLHSPVACTESLVVALERLGRVGWFVAPSRFHDLYLGDWVKRFPGTPLCAAQGLEDDHPELRCHPLLADNLREAWSPDVRLAAIEGMPGVNEVVLLHEPSRTLIVADLVFNLGDGGGPLHRALTTLIGVRNRCAPSRLFRMFVRDRARFRASLQRILAWDFERLVMGHGGIVESGARETLRRAYGIRCVTGTRAPV